MRRALAFLTLIGGSATPDASTVAWFPVVGALVGLAVGGVWWAADSVWSRALAAGVFVVVDLGLTGMLHLDGLVDTADGVLPHLERERRLAVMSEPTVGAFGVGAAIAVLLLRFAAVASMDRDVLLIGGLWCLSRTIMAVAVRTLPYGRPSGGLASSFQGRPGGWAIPAASGIVLGGGLVVAGDGLQGAAAAAAAVMAGAAVLALGLRRLGGYTGDLLGAAGIIAETIGLLVAAGHR